MDNLPKQEIDELKCKINKYDYHYYILSEPIIDDYEYDLTVKKLEAMELKYPLLKTVDSPTNRVSSDLTKEFSPHSHRYPMLSLSNTYNEGELYDFDKSVRKELPQDEKIEYVVELKIDGLSISLNYINGFLVTGTTRGDGTVGDDVTANVKTIRSIPLKIDIAKYPNLDLSDIEIRGEVYLEKASLDRLNAEKALSGEKLYANPRNVASGTLKLLDPKIVASRRLQIFTYFILSDKLKSQTQFENLNLLKDLGFSVNPHFTLCDSIESVIEVCSRFEAMRDQLPYEIDGAVVKVNSVRQQNILGSIQKSPLWARAYKFKAPKASTKLRSITWQVGRTGAITPVAELEPVLLAGSTISRSTLHNLEEITRLDLRVGDFVVLEKRGDVIPKVSGTILELREPDAAIVEAPLECPVCGSEVLQPENEVALYCSNYNCSAQVKGRIEHFASRGAMDIEGLGIAIIDTLVNMGFLNNYSDIYSLYLRKDELIGIERFGEKSISNLIENIELSKQKPFAKVLFAIGIRNVGAGVAKKLSDHFQNIEAIINATEEEVKSVYEMGPIIARSIKKFFADELNMQVMEKLRVSGLRFVNEKKIVHQNFFLGKTFVLTGSLTSLTREVASQKISDLGGKTSTSVSAKTHYLIAGENAGAKLKKAKELGVNVLSEEELLNLLSKE